MPRRPAPVLVPLALVALLAVGGPRARAQEAAAGGSERYTVRAELGPELDTNAHRSEVIHVPGFVNRPAVVSPLARAVLGASLSDVLGNGHQVSLSATLAAKVFATPDA